MLYAIAVKMVGKLEDAEDIVQDTFEKYLTIDTTKIQNTKAYLIKSVSNNCLQFLNSFKNRIAESNQSIDHDFEDVNQVKSIFNFDREVQLMEAWGVLQRKLEPVERAIYIMREVFSVEYDELQEMFNKKKDNCRQIVSRAKAKVQNNTPKLRGELPKVHLPLSFKNACRFGHLSEMMHDLTGDKQDSIP
jgi:RNA polymerase sigma-70 factor (ECF subfamily)